MLYALAGQVISNAHKAGVTACIVLRLSRTRAVHEVASFVNAQLISTTARTQRDRSKLMELVEQIFQPLAALERKLVFLAEGEHGVGGLTAACLFLLGQRQTFTGDGFEGATTSSGERLTPRAIADWTISRRGERG